MSMPSAPEPGKPAERANGAASIYRRQIRTRTLAAGTVVGALEDNPHHFRVRVEHDDERVTRIEAESVRYPWTTCPSAEAPLRALEGMRLSPRSTAVGQAARARDNCTHMFDLAGLCVAHAHRAVRGGPGERHYACAVWNDPSAGAGCTRATLARDGAPLLEWVMRDGRILHPAPFRGVSLRDHFMAWAERQLAQGLAEAALVLRRACFIAPSRLFDFDRVERADALEGMQGACHTFSAAHVGEALRNPGTYRDYSACPERMLEGLPERGESLGETPPAAAHNSTGRPRCSR